MIAIFEMEIRQSILVSVIHALIKCLIVFRTCCEEVFRDHCDFGDALIGRMILFFVRMNTMNQIKEEFIIFLLHESLEETC
jgi:hypothetical protein